MSTTKRVLIALWASFMVAHVVKAGILGHSGVVLHVDKYGHMSGHSSHYDYRFYPEEVLLHPLPLLDHHNIIGHSHHHIDDDLNEAFGLIEDEHEYHEGHKPYSYYLGHDDHHRIYDHHHHLHHR